MGWFIRRVPHPAEPQPVVPEKVETEFPFIGFKDGTAWSRPVIGQKYHRTECLYCGEKMGTCQGITRFRQLKRIHRTFCKDTCGFLDCVDCGDKRDNLKPWTTYEAV